MGDCLPTGMVVWASSSGVLTGHTYLLLLEASVTHPSGFKPTGPHLVHASEGSFRLTHFPGVPDRVSTS